jgi:glycosyltransferase involved in cell wall biosynthesis
MNIAIYAICKNEEQFVQRFCDSAKDADLILIADTGSTDKTVELALECGAKVYDICISPWRFDKARDAALALLPKDIDVCISLEDPKFPKGHPQIAQPAMQQGVLLAANFKNKSLSKPLKSFSYKDLGSMATVGRNFAVVELPFFKFQGFRAWLFWMLVHLMSIVGVKNRLLIFINWVWNYISYDQSLRLIIKPRHKEIE